MADDVFEVMLAIAKTESGLCHPQAAFVFRQNEAGKTLHE